MEKIKVKNCMHCPFLIPSIFACGNGKYAKAIWNPFVKLDDCPFKENEEKEDEKE